MRQNGTVKWFNTTKGYGFAEPDDKSKDIFIYISAVELSGLGGLNEGQRISYKIESKDGKVSAINIELA